MFDLARAGDTETLRAYAGAGAPVIPADGKGDTLLMPTAYYGHAETLGTLVTCGPRLTVQTTEVKCHLRVPCSKRNLPWSERCRAQALIRTPVRRP
ncbi:hypothetical protein ACTMTI_26845 [Nonomuraea sp. H19]|uniref:hypothetical protein n=1 Tax=Nonomuraea sp. H19 TaxID=3452206 RepID=UPI003F888F3B